MEGVWSGRPRPQPAALGAEGVRACPHTAARAPAGNRVVTVVCGGARHASEREPGLGPWRAAPPQVWVPSQSWESFGEGMKSYVNTGEVSSESRRLVQPTAPNGALQQSSSVLVTSDLCDGPSTPSELPEATMSLLT